jgi:hypothetical protein
MTVEQQGVTGLGNNRLMTGGAGVVLMLLGAFLVSSGSGPFVVGLLVLLVGVGLIVRLLLALTESVGSGGGGAAGDARSGAGFSAGAGLGGFFNFTGVKFMSAMSQWVAGALMGALSLLGLFLYSRAADGMFGMFGGLLFLFGLAVIIVLVHQATDYSSEAHRHDEDENRPDQGQAAA